MGDVKPTFTNGMQDSTEDSHSFKNLSYTTLAGMIKEGPVALKSMLHASGAANIRVGHERTGAESEMIEQRTRAQGQVLPGTVKKKVKNPMPKRGEIFFHLKRGTRVTIIHACVDQSPSGDAIHEVRESLSGAKFRALNKNLKRT